MKNQSYVGYVPLEGMLAIIIRCSAFKHLSDICKNDVKPNTQDLFDEVATRDDFRVWLQ